MVARVIVLSLVLTGFLLAPVYAAVACDPGMDSGMAEMAERSDRTGGDRLDLATPDCPDCVYCTSAIELDTAQDLLSDSRFEAAGPPALPDPALTRLPQPPRLSVA